MHSSPEGITRETGGKANELLPFASVGRSLSLRSFHRWEYINGWVSGNKDVAFLRRFVTNSPFFLWPIPGIGLTLFPISFKIPPVVETENRVRVRDFDVSFVCRCV